MTLAKINDIFTQSLLGDYDADSPWEAVRTLREIGSREVFDQAAKWCGSLNLMERARGADVLAQLGKTPEHPSNLYPEESFTVISALLRAETEPLPLSSAIYALGHIGNPLSVPLVTQHRTHPEPDVRFAVAFALGNFADDPVAVGALLPLTRDADDDVRDWATFGIGALGKLDSPDIRDALVDRLGDSFEDVRQEAMVGLARLKDQRVLSALLSVLELPSVADITIDAASEMLGKQDDVLGWTGRDYAEALRDRFGR
jgi:HEAT repeat protein